jgi:hypothetical protein
MKPLTWLASYVTNLQKRKKIGFCIYKAKTFLIFHKPESNPSTPSLFQRSAELPIHHNPLGTSAIPVSLSFYTLLTVITTGYRTQHWHSLFV